MTCVDTVSGVPAERISHQNIVDFYSTRLPPEQLNRVFA